MREWTERHILELIHKVWDKLKKDLNNRVTNPFKGVYLNLYSVISSEVVPPVAVWNNGGLSLTSRLIPIFKTDDVDKFGIQYHRTELVQVIKIQDVYPLQWDYFYGNIGERAHMVVYQSAVSVGGGYRKEIFSEDDNVFIKWLKNVLSNKKGIIQTFGHVMPRGNLKAYSGIDMESTVDITVREVYWDRFNGYTVVSTSPLAKIQTWKFESQPPDSTCWVFATSDGVELTKEQRLEAVKRFKVVQEYQKEVIDLGDLDHEAYE